MAEPGPIYTIGHSTRSAAEFLELLRTHGIRQLADVRTVPKSARHPQFNAPVLDRFLHENGIAYRHFPALGGLRRPRPDSVNSAWRHPGFRGYADHMQSPTFREGLAELMAFAVAAPTAAMCAEAVWWRCHRQLLADALLVHGVPVLHVLDSKAPKLHRLSDFARVDGGELSYPGLV
jgi:uncharacterized protein (DUF488 family)